MKMPTHFTVSAEGLLQTKHNKPCHCHSHALCQLLLATCALCTTAHAATNNLPQQINPLQMLTGGLDPDTELSISKRFSVGTLFTNQDYDFAGEEINVLGYGIRADWYFIGTQASGAFLSPFAKVWAFDTVEGAQASQTRDMIRPDTTTYGALLGYNWMARSFRLHTGIGWAVSYAANDPFINDSILERQDLWQTQTSKSGRFLLDFGVNWAF